MPLDAVRRRRGGDAPPSMSTDARGVTTFGPGLQTGGQVADLGGGKFGVSGAPGSVGDTSPNFYDDPVVNSIVAMPSRQDAESYTGAKPSFYGVQRPGDWQRATQRQMAADRLPGGMRDLDALTQNRIARERLRAGVL